MNPRSVIARQGFMKCYVRMTDLIHVSRSMLKIASIVRPAILKTPVRISFGQYLKAVVALTIRICNNPA